MTSGSLTDSLRETLTLFNRAEPGTPLTTTEVADRLDLGRRSTYERLERLADQEYLETKKVGARGRVWWRPLADNGDSRGDSGRMFSRLIGNVPGMVYRCRNEPGWAMLFVSDAATDITGYHPETLEDGDVSWGEDIVHPEDRVSLREEIRSQLEKSDQFTVEYRIRSADGEIRWVRERGCAVVEEGTSSGVLEGVVTDITEQKRSEQELLETEQRFRSFVQAVEEYAIIMLDPEGHVQTWNEGAHQITGYEREEIIGEHVKTFYTDEDRTSKVPEANLTTAANQGTIEDEGWRVRADGSRFWANITITAIHADNGDLRGYAKVTCDMTDRRERERQLLRERDLIERIFETSPVGLGVRSPDDFERLNAQAAEILNVQASGDDEAGDPAIYDADGQPIPPDERPTAHVFATGEPVEGWECRVEGADGVSRWLSVNVAPLNDAAGDIERVVVAAEDITHLKEQARQLERQRDALKDELSEVYERIDDGFYALDDGFRFTYVNERAEELLGHAEAELLGESVLEVIPEAADSSARESFERALKTQQPTSFEVYYSALDSWIEASVYPSETGLSIYAKDVTERKEREHELERYETIVETIREGVYVVDQDGRFTWVNSAYAELTGYPAEELVGAHVTKVVDEETIQVAIEYEEKLRAGDSDPGMLETNLQTANGTTVPAAGTFVMLSREDGPDRRVGVARDITDRKQYEETLMALYDSAHELFGAETKDEVSEIVVETATHVMDLSSVATYVYDEAESHLYPAAQSLGIVETELSPILPDNSTITGHVYATGEPYRFDDITDSPYMSPGGADMHAGVFAPMGEYGVLVVGSEEDNAFDADTQRLVELLATNAKAAYDRVERERTLKHQRKQLIALDNLNGVVRQITEAVLEQSTREEIERVVVEALADADSYECAWIGNLDPDTETVQLRTTAGVKNHIDGVSVPVDSDNSEYVDLTRRVVQAREMQVQQDVSPEVLPESWQDPAHKWETQSAAGIPIIHEGASYGVLTVYAARPDAFGTDEREVIGQLGDIVSHAIAAVERKRALTSSEVVEVVFRIPDFVTAFDLPITTEGTITLDQAVPVGDGTYLQYGTATDSAIAIMEALVETDSLPHWDSVTVLQDDDETRFEVKLIDPPVLSIVTAHGGYVQQAAIEDGDYTMQIHLAMETDVRRIIESIEAAYPGIEMLARRRVTRTGPSTVRLERTLEEKLTDRQRTSLEAAYKAGYFEWPRGSSGEAVAASIGISPPTFHQHLRKAHRRLLATVFDEQSDD
ncbi:PAS domain S-box protein [Haloarcula amylovorans]|uniref:PAS domain S-box protein n=1 Tax=Haloarcula amylovorans TaxID=2562280 RepID=UPI00142F7591|nr:PAS domain S-box protein [Halomicroarcula amylolytica]